MRPLKRSRELLFVVCLHFLRWVGLFTMLFAGDALVSATVTVTLRTDACSAEVPPLFHRGRKLGDGHYYMISVSDADDGFEFVAYDPRTCVSYRRVVTYAESTSLVSHDASLSKDSLVLAGHLARRLVLDVGTSTLSFGPGTWRGCILV